MGWAGFTILLTNILLVAGQVATLFLMMGIGFALFSAGKLGKEATAQLAYLLVYVVIPCLVVDSLQIERDMGMLRGMGIAFAANLAYYAIALPASALLFRRKPPGTRAVMRFGVIYSNVGYMGFPLIAAVFGGEAMIYAVMTLAVFILFQWTHGLYLMGGSGGNGGNGMVADAGAGTRNGNIGGHGAGAMAGADVGNGNSSGGGRSGGDGISGEHCTEADAGDGVGSGSIVARGGIAGIVAQGGIAEIAAQGGIAENAGTGVRPRMPARSLFLNPGILALLAGMSLFLLDFRLPAPIGRAVSFVSDLNTPLAMIVIGAQIAQSDVGKALRSPSMYAACLLKLVLFPLAAAIALLPFRLPAAIYAVTVVLCATPMAAQTSILAERYGRDAETAAQIVAMSTLMSLVTLPFFAGFL
jgi:predicted permease